MHLFILCSVYHSAWIVRIVGEAGKQLYELEHQNAQPQIGHYMDLAERVPREQRDIILVAMERFERQCQQN